MCAGVPLSRVLLGMFSNPQEVAVKEQLTGKGKLNRRSISSPSMNRRGALLTSCLDASLSPCEGAQLSLTSLCWLKCLIPSHVTSLPPLPLFLLLEPGGWIECHGHTVLTCPLPPA
ncbi:hypothetical protein A6R68_18978 [Neotoma lepida]|uniref:Uncharacterized protein n=1 Tax=Neotoma lepida TaxID=56216 RepID=A0A1A6HKY4_NEOLE|nr:hypothetical protein A6R68_18978 [Neotoma lepida]